MAFCLPRSSPYGSIEQHGLHLALDTDAVIAEGFAHCLAAHIADRRDVWVELAVRYRLSPEHARTPGTVTLAPTCTSRCSVHSCLEGIGRAPKREFVFRRGDTKAAAGGTFGLQDDAFPRGEWRCQSLTLA